MSSAHPGRPHCVAVLAHHWTGLPDVTYCQDCQARLAATWTPGGLWAPIYAALRRQARLAALAVPAALVALTLGGLPR